MWWSSEEERRARRKVYDAEVDERFASERADHCQEIYEQMKKDGCSVEELKDYRDDTVSLAEEELADAQKRVQEAREEEAKVKSQDDVKKSEEDKKREELERKFMSKKQNSNAL